MQEVMKNKAKELLASGEVRAVIGWKKGEFCYDITPAVFTNAEEIDNGFIYDDFCGANLSKYLIKEAHKDGKVLVFLKPCDTYSFNQLLSEHRINREKVYVVGVSCDGKVDIENIKRTVGDGIIALSSDGDKISVETLYDKYEINRADALAERCVNCKSKKHVAYDELLGDEGEVLDSKRFDEVEMIENMTADERFEFWRNELSRCIRCNACRNVCPACSCEKCIFDNDNSGYVNKAPVTSFEENMFHIIRAFHVAGRCTDCGECSRVCPQGIPLHLLNRKFIKDINTLYGDYQAGEDPEARGPLTSYTEKDPEPSVVTDKE
ncbi:MAG: 4Fe-4S dicluster domain-containing protein [Clostridia bacterium]|nr:4Fe-4S dicluster domain-containing protein [Clostridia bacterium]